jgi:chromosome partitioning protein
LCYDDTGAVHGQPPSTTEDSVARVIAISNLKGGIGKTTTVVNVGAGLALRGNRVLLVDTDAQGNLAMALGVKPRRTLYDVLVDNVAPAACIINTRPNLDLLGADATLLGAQPVIAKRSDWSRVLSLALRPTLPEYDIILIDSAGSLTPLNVNALVCASDVIAPTTIEHFSIKSLELLFTQVARVKGGNGSIRMIVPTMYDPRVRQSSELLSNLQQRYGALVAPPVRVNVRLSEAPAQGQTIYEYDPRSRGAADYAHLVEHIAQTFNLQASPSSKPAPPPRPQIPSLSVGNGISTISEASQRCPHCGRLLEHATLAGYRVSYCDNCKYKTQTLVQSPRR